MSDKRTRPAATGRIVPARRNARESIAQTAARFAAMGDSEKGEAALVPLFGAFMTWVFLCEIGVL